MERLRGRDAVEWTTETSMHSMYGTFGRRRGHWMEAVDCRIVVESTTTNPEHRVIAISRSATSALVEGDDGGKAVDSSTLTPMH